MSSIAWGDAPATGGKGLGPLNYEARRGMYLHPTYAVTPGREPLGRLDAWMWASEKRDADGVHPGQKESARWIEGYERIAEMAALMPQTRLVYLADRKADMVAMMQRARELGTPADWLVRAKYNRCLPGEEGEKRWEYTSGGEALGEIAFTMPARGPQKARPVRQQLWASGRNFRWQTRAHQRHQHRGARSRCAR